MRAYALGQAPTRLPDGFGLCLREGLLSWTRAVPDRAPLGTLEVPPVPGDAAPSEPFVETLASMVLRLIPQGGTSP